MIKILLSLLVLLSAFLFGYVLAKNTKEELRAGKKVVSVNYFNISNLNNCTNIY